MKTTMTARFCCRSPLINLFEKTLMFTTLIPQYLNKLVECKVGDFTPPQSFHTVKVQRFNDNRIKLLTKLACQLPAKIFALIRNLTVQPCDLSDTTPPAVRTFDFTTQCFVERPKFVQGLFQGLAVLYLLTRAKCQVCVFHAEICPNAFTCCRQRSKIFIGCCKTKPIVPATITLYRNLTKSPMPLTVLMKGVRYPIKLPFACFRIPFTKGYRKPIVFQRPTCRTRVSDRFKFMSLFNLWSTTEFLEKTIISFINTSKLLLNSLTRQRLPMRVCRPFQLRQVRTHSSIVRIRQTVFVTLTLPLMEIYMHLPHIVKQVTYTDTIRLIIKRIFISFHGISSIKSLTPAKWVGRHIAVWQRLACLPT